MDSTKSDSISQDGLPTEFFERLTKRQRTLLKILLDANGNYVRGMVIRQRMRDEYGLSVPNHTGALNGVISGFTQRYSRQFKCTLIPGRWIDETQQEAEFKIGPTYEAELRDRFE